MKRLQKALTLPALLAACSFSLYTALVKTAVAADFEVIANRSVPATALSQIELRQIMLTNQTLWSDGERIILVALAPGSEQADTLTNDSLGMPSQRAKIFWQTKHFDGVLLNPVQTGDSVAEVVCRVANTPGAIGVVPHGTEPGEAKIIS